MEKNWILSEYAITAWDDVQLGDAAQLVVPLSAKLLGCAELFAIIGKDRGVVSATRHRDVRHVVVEQVFRA